MPNRIRRYNGTSWVTVYDEANFSSLSFSTIAVSGQSSVVADTTGDTLTLAAGTGIGITTDAGTDTITVATNGVSTNTGNTLVLRNPFGGFSAGTITATLSGNASTATTLQTARTINGTSFNGSADITVSVGTNEINNSAVTDVKLASNAVTTAKILNGAVTNAKLSTTAGEPGGSWLTYTPTVTGVSNTTVTGAYMRIGKTVWFRVKVLLTSTSVVSAAPEVTLPLASVADVPSSAFEVRLVDASTLRWYGGQGIEVNADKITAYAMLVPASSSAAYSYGAAVTSTVPFTWATGDYVEVSGCYETSAA